MHLAGGPQIVSLPHLLRPQSHWTASLLLGFEQQLSRTWGALLQGSEREPARRVPEKVQRHVPHTQLQVTRRRLHVLRGLSSEGPPGRTPVAVTTQPLVHLFLEEHPDFPSGNYHPHVQE